MLGSQENDDIEQVGMCERAAEVQREVLPKYGFEGNSVGAAQALQAIAPYLANGSPQLIERAQLLMHKRVFEHASWQGDGHHGDHDQPMDALRQSGESQPQMVCGAPDVKAYVFQSWDLQAQGEHEWRLLQPPTIEDMPDTGDLNGNFLGL